MNFLELAQSRYSERSFDSTRPVEADKLSQILEAGRSAPTACNYQPQRIYVLQSTDALQKARQLGVSHYNAPLMILVCYDAKVAWHNQRDRRYSNYCAGEQDATIVAATMMYEAEELGIHTLWLRGFDSQAVAETFSLPDHEIPVMMFAMGYPSVHSKPGAWHSLRKSLKETVTIL